MRKRFLLFFLTILSLICFSIGISACTHSGGSSSQQSDSQSVTSSISDNNDSSSDSSTSYSDSTDSSYEDNSNSGGSMDDTSSGNVSSDETSSDDEEPDVDGELEYTLSDDGTYYIVSGIGGCTDTDIVIPSAYNDIPVAAIGDYAFRGTSITSVTIPDSVSSIGEQAFSYCFSLASIIIPDSINIIGNNAFTNCSSLISATIENGTIGDSAFSYCSSLVSVTIGNGVTSVGSNAFYYCSSLESITIGTSVTSIGNNAFHSCKTLEKINFNATAMEDLSYDNYVFYCAGQSGSGITVTIGANVTIIPAYLFYPRLQSNYDYSPEITSVLFEDGSLCESIGIYAFGYCTSLKSVTIPDNITTIGSSAFSGCTALTEINFNATAMEDLSYNDSIFSNAGQGGNGITVTIGANVTKIPAYLFYRFSSIVSIVFEDDCVCESIGNEAFYECTSLTCVYYSGTASEWASISFANGTANPLYYAGNLYLKDELATDITIEGITTINDYAFCNCISLTNIKIDADVTSIGIAVFENCKSLTEIYFNATAMEDLSSGNDLFGNAGKSGSGVTVTIGANVTKIPAYLFNSYQTPNIVSVVFEDGCICESIGAYALCGCASLESITIPESITSIGNSAFSDCTSLIKINFNATAMEDLSFSNGIFNYAGQSGNGITVTIGANVTRIPDYLFCPNYSDSYAPNITSVAFENNSVCKSMGAYAFYNCTELTEIYFDATAMEDLSSYSHIFDYAGQTSSGITVTIGASVTKIPAYLFSDAKYITSVVFEDNSICESMGTYAFYYCTSLESITISDSVTSIGEYAFYNCAAEIIWGDNPAITEIGSYAFAHYSGTSITIPESIETMGDSAFYNCSSLKSATIQGGSIGNNAFSSCKALESITISDNVKSIGNYAFSGCTTLEYINMGDNVKSVGDYAFGSCTALKNITIPDNVTSIGSYAFYNCTAEIIWGDNPAITEIGSYAFAYYAGTSITIPKSVTTVGNSAFYNCTSLKEIYFNATAMEDLSEGNNAFNYAGQSGDGIIVTIGTEVTKIPAYLFYSSSSSAPNITRIVFEDNSVCESIGIWAFKYCIFLENIEIPDSVTSIGNYAFYGCIGLDIITMGNGIISIGTYAFFNCTAEIIWGDNPVISEIGNRAFSYYAGTSMTIPDSVTSIGENAFYGCASLESITIPESVTSIGGYAFCNCTALTEINFNATAMEDLSEGNNAFNYAGQSGDGITVNIGTSVTKIPAYLFYSSKSTNNANIISVVFEKGSVCETIGNYAFYNCTALTEIYFNATAMEDLSEGNNVFTYAGQSGEGITVTIGSCVTKIPAYLFYASSHSGVTPNITSIVFEDSSVCKSLGAYAFCNCTAEIIWGDNPAITEISSYAFAYYAGTSITIPDNVTSIDEYAFYNCTALEKINFNATAMDDLSLFNSIFNNAGQSGDGITVTIGANVTKIPDYLFYYAEYITSVIFEDNSICTSIGSNAFAFCSSLTSIIVGTSITTIGDYAFDYCTLLTSIAIPDSLTSIGNEAFYNCTAEIIWGDNPAITEIGSHAFAYYKGTSIIIPDSVTSIENEAFYNCTAEIMWGDNPVITGIGSRAFAYYKGTSISIPDSIITIGSYAFYRCKCNKSTRISVLSLFIKKLCT